ncbi:transferase family-domain-containing protein [Plectosphaerella plurivora]|uniref:Transferase family-domain-containing protein n=1 Tax=Plectosphaerella plurivora TaxID=936078 RepID=A0A9P8VFX3_9PEZI|nr:transferase family-domain-containing protein [Plectosphaerella plurivora]
MSQILASKQLRPSAQPTGPVSVPLSILDAGCARLATAGAIWTFDAPAAADQDVLVNRLEASFVTTLNDFPHWAGQLHWTPCRQGGLHTERFNRPMITYGSPHDPGVEWNVVRLSRRAGEVAPEAATRAAGSQVWVANDFPQAELIASKTSLALQDLKTYQDMPSMLVQVSLFEDGGFAVAIKMSHALADASALLTFMHRWAANCRSLFGTGSEALDPPVFDPQLLDSKAAGTMDTQDPALVAAARSLPLHRFDWWATEAKGYPSFLAPTTENSRPSDPSLLEAAKNEPSSEPPWETWNMMAPVTHAVIHFSGPQVEAIRGLARPTAPKCSRLDALLAHVWSGINRARGLADDDDDVFLNVTLGIRSRVSPPLPDTFLGSPLILSHIASRGREASASDSSGLGTLAARVRACLEVFTPDAVSAVLHEAIHTVSPQRLWRAFLGQRHVIVTSWLRLGVNEVDFIGNGTTPRYAHPIMPYMDGCMQVMDSAAGDGGMDVSLYLESGAMTRLLEDDSLLRREPEE